MESWSLRAVSLAVILLLLAGCSGGGRGGSPVEPAAGESAADALGLTESRDGEAAGRGRMLLGLWDIVLDPDAGFADVVPLRGSAFHANVVQFLQKPTSLSFTFPTPAPPLPQVVVNVTINHPFQSSDTDYKGFDVRGVVFGSGPSLYSSKDDPDLIVDWYDPDGLRLGNADGWTRWWNPSEFKPAGLFGYTPGGLGTPSFVCHATINPYKYFANALGLTDEVPNKINQANRGAFAPGSSATRRYELVFPMVGGKPDVRFQYAVDASWKGPSGGVFPADANCPEAFHIEITQNGTLIFGLGTPTGDLSLDLEIFDWGEKGTGFLGEVGLVTIQSETLFASKVPATFTGLSPTGLSGTYHVAVPAADVTTTGLTGSGQEVLVTVLSSVGDSYQPPDPGFTYPKGALAAYNLWGDVAVAPAGSSMGPAGEFTPGGLPIDVETRDNVCYLLDSSSELLILNVTNPDYPSLLNSVTLTETPIALDVESGHVYVIDNGSNLQVVDVDPIDAAGIVSSLALSGTLTAIDVDELYAYVGDASGNLHIIDIDPVGSEFIVNTLTTTESINDVKVRDGYAYVAADDLEIFDVDPAGSAYSVTVVDTTTPATAVDVTDSGYAFVGNQSNYLLVVDVNPPETANVVDTVLFDGQVNDIVYDGTLAYMTVADGSFQSVYFDSSTNTAYPTGGNDTLTLPTELSIDGNMGYVIDGADLIFVELWFEDPPEGWARAWKAGTTFDLYAQGVAFDGSGNVYVAGKFAGTVDLDPGTGEDIYTSQGIQDIFLSKFDSTGGFLWGHAWSTTADYDEGRAVVADSQNSVYILGRFQGDMDFDPGPGSDIHTFDPNSLGFLIKLDSSGNYEWGLQLLGDPADVDVDGSDNVYTFGSQAMTRKFDSEGNQVWYTNWSAANASGIDVTDAGAVYLSGECFTSTDFDPGPDEDLYTSNGGRDAFVSYFDSSGTYQWFRAWGGIGEDYGHDVAVDSSGNISVTGRFQDTVDFDPGPGDDLHTQIGGLSDIYLTHFDSGGNFQWAHTWGANTGGFEYGREVSVDGWGNIYFTGRYCGDIDFDPGPGEEILPSVSVDNAFLARFDPSGSFEWARYWGHWAYGAAVDVDDSGDVVNIGTASGGWDFDPGPGYDYRGASGGWHVFVVKLLPNGYYYWY